jgi:hypothetical protein
MSDETKGEGFVAFVETIARCRLQTWQKELALRLANSGEGIDFRPYPRPRGRRRA